jgi:hypothetical protein
VRSRRSPEQRTLTPRPTKTTANPSNDGPERAAAAGREVKKGRSELPPRPPKAPERSRRARTVRVQHHRQGPKCAAGEVQSTGHSRRARPRRRPEKQRRPGARSGRRPRSQKGTKRTTSASTHATPGSRRARTVRVAATASGSRVRSWPDEEQRTIPPRPVTTMPDSSNDGPERAAAAGREVEEGTPCPHPAPDEAHEAVRVPTGSQAEATTARSAQRPQAAKSKRGRRVRTLLPTKPTKPSGSRPGLRLRPRRPGARSGRRPRSRRGTKRTTSATTQGTRKVPKGRARSGSHQDRHGLECAAGEGARRGPPTTPTAPPMALRSIRRTSTLCTT